MKNTRRIIVLFICCILLFTALSRVFAQGSPKEFSDVSPGDWFAPMLADASARKIISGCPDGSFKPNNPVSYGEFLAMSLALETIVQEEKPAHWAKSFLDHAVSCGYIAKEDFSAKCLDDPIPRRDMALLLSGLIKARGVDFDGEEKVFSDLIADDPRNGHIALCTRAGVLSGYPDGSFRPNGSLKRCEAVAAVMCYLKLLDDSLELGSEVLAISGNILEYVDVNGCYSGVRSDGVYMELSPKDPNEGVHPVNLMRSDHKELLEQIIATAKISGSPGNYTLSYTQPEIPERYHFAVDLFVFKRNDQGGDDYLFYKTSDAGWMADRKNYDPSAQTVVWKLGSKVNNFENKSVIISFEVDDMISEDGDFGEGAAFQYFLDYDGSVQRISLSCRLADGKFKDYYRYDAMPCPVFCW